MTQYKRWLLVAALACAPAAAVAQPQPLTPPAPPERAPAASEFPGNAVEDEGMWFDDELLAFGLADEFYTDTGDLDGADDDMAEAPAGPSGAHRAAGRAIGRGPGGVDHMPGAGMTMGMGMGSDFGRGMGQGMWMGRHMPGMHGVPGMRGAMRMRLAHMDLTEVQREKLRALHEANTRRAIQRSADLRLARLDLHKLMRADKPDAGAVNAQIDRMTKLHADGMKAAFDTRMQARAVLTPEQWKQLHTPGAGPGGMRHELMDTPDGAPKR